jgi:hypothetical protein
VGPVGGWNIREKSGKVALASEQEHMAMLKAKNPDVELLSRHAISISMLEKLGMTEGDITERVPLDCKQ